MPGHKGQNRFRYSRSVSPDNPSKKKRPNESLSSVADEDSDESLLSNILDRASGSEEGIRRITSVILANSAIKNAVSMKLTSELDKLKTEVKNLSAQVDDLAQYSRKNCLRFSGIAERSSEGREDTDKIVLNICNKVILRSSGTTLDVGDIDNSHRLGPKPRSSRDPPRDIIVKFTRYRSRAVVYGNKRNLKNYNRNPSSGYKVFINEALTKRRANVFSRLRRCKRDGLIDSCWTSS